MKRAILLIIFSFLIVSSRGWDLPTCNLTTIKDALPARIFAEQTIDGSSQLIIVTRIFHNKLTIFTSEAARCYFNSFDLNFLYQSTSPIGLIALIYLASKTASGAFRLLMLLFLIVPIMPFLDIPKELIVYCFKIFAIIALVSLTIEVPRLKPKGARTRIY